MGTLRHVILSAGSCIREQELVQSEQFSLFNLFYGQVMEELTMRAVFG